MFYSKLPFSQFFFAAALMLEPILHDKQAEHRVFCQFARSLFERVTGTPFNPNESYEIERIRRVRFFGVLLVIRFFRSKFRVASTTFSYCLTYVTSC